MQKMIAILLIFVILSCNQPESDDTQPGDFAVFLLSDSTIAAAEAFSQPIDTLLLADSAIITVDDMQSYIWSTHSFCLTEGPDSTFEEYYMSHGSTSGIPFVVTVGDERIYFGTFWWAYSSITPPACAVIYLITPRPYKIRLATNAVDRRNDMRVYDSLKHSNVLVD